MSCSISLDINKGKYADIVEVLGAKSTVNVSNIVTDLKTYKTTIALPKSIADSKNRIAPGLDKVKSYALSGTAIDPNTLGDMLQEAGRAQPTQKLGGILKAGLLDVELIRGTEAFLKSKNKIISPIGAGTTRVAYEVGEAAKSTTSKDRSTVTISRDEANTIYSNVRTNNPGLGSAKTMQLFSKQLSHIVSSAMFRGFDVKIAFRGASEGIKSGVDNFNSYLNGGQKAIHASNQNSRPVGTVKFNEIDDLVYVLDSKTKVQKSGISEDFGFLNSFLSASERKVLDRFKQASRASRIVVAKKVINVFEKMVPNLKHSLLSQYEINELYGATFAGKKGFIIGNEVVINVDKFDVSTVFHEFGHFYMRWLKSYKPKVHKKLLAHTMEKHGDDLFASYKALYDSTGIAFNEEEIIEEIFVDNLGMLAAKKLVATLPIDAIRSNRYTMEDTVLPEGESIPVDLSDVGPEAEATDTTRKNTDGPVSVTYKGVSYTVTPDNQIISGVSGNKVFANTTHGSHIMIKALAEIERGVAQMVAFKGTLYIVNTKGEILSTKSSKIVFADVKHGNRQPILDLATELTPVEAVEVDLEEKAPERIKTKITDFFVETDRVIDRKLSRDLGRIVNVDGEKYMVTGDNVIYNSNRAEMQWEKYDVRRIEALVENAVKNDEAVFVTIDGETFAVFAEGLVIDSSNTPVVNEDARAVKARLRVQDIEFIAKERRGLLTATELKKQRSAEIKSGLADADVHVSHFAWVTLKNKPVFEGNNVNALRPLNKDIEEHFGNPWTGSGVDKAIAVGPYSDKTYSQLKANPSMRLANIRVAVQNYKEWLLGDGFLDVEPERRAWIIDTIMSGDMDSANIKYMTKPFPYYSHADVLADVVEAVKKKKRQEYEASKVFSYRGTTVATPVPLGLEQTQALIDMIEFAEGRTSAETWTLQGAAGTGKTTIIGVLTKYLSAKTFRFLTPTHAANAKLAFANLEYGITAYPTTLASALATDRRTGEKVMAKSLNPRGKKNVYIIDEASMISAEQLADFESAAENVQNVRIIYLGDPAQIPAKEGNAKGYSLSKVFLTAEKTELKKVYRQNPNSLLTTLNKIKGNDRLIVYDVENSDDSLQMLDGAEFESSLIDSFAKEAEDSVYIAFRNYSVAEANKRIKKGMAQRKREKGLYASDTDLEIGDMLVGYIGDGTKKTSKNTLANSMSYKVTDLEEINRDGTRFLSVQARSKMLHRLASVGMDTLVHTVTTKLVPLSMSDDIMIEGITHEELDANNRMISDLVHDAYAQLEKIATIKTAWKEREDLLKHIKRSLSSYEFSNSYVYNVKTRKFEVLSEKNNSLYGSFGATKPFLLEKGVSWGYAITAHKAQGATYKNVFVDVKDIQESMRGEDHIIYGEGGKAVNTLKNALYYVAMSRASGKVVINRNATSFDSILTEADMKEINSSEAIKLSNEASRSIEDFTVSFVNSLLSHDLLTPSEVGFTLESTVGDMFNISFKEGNNTDLVDSTASDSFKDFFVQKATPKEVFNGLIAKGLVTGATGVGVYLTDMFGNRVDMDGNLGGDVGPFMYVAEPKTAADRKINAAFLVKADGYINKFSNHATALFSVGSAPLDTETKIRALSDKVEINADATAYIINEKSLNRTTSEIERKFDSQANVDGYVRQKVWSDARKSYLDDRPGTKNDSKTMKEALEHADEVLANVSQEQLDEVRELFETKTTEGTFLHNILELFSRSLNLAQKIDYSGIHKGRAEEGMFLEGTDKVSHKYFRKHIIEAITNPDRDAFEAYFGDFFFSRMALQEGTKEYDDFKEVYEFVRDNMDNKSFHGSYSLLTKVSDVFDEHIYKKLQGPLTFMPEVKLASETLGVAGMIDLIVIDGKGVAHIFDYKTKEVGKERYWKWEDEKRQGLKGTLSHFPSNSMMKASIQTSIYKLMLNEIGIVTGPANVLYVESVISGYVKASGVHKGKELGENTASIFEERGKMRYVPENVIVKPLIDVSSEVADQYSKDGRDVQGFTPVEIVRDIDSFITLVSGTTSAEVSDAQALRAKKMYDNAIVSREKRQEEKVGSQEQLSGLAFIRDTMGTGSLPLIIRLPGGMTHTVPKDIKGEADTVEYILQKLEERFGLKRVGATLENEFTGKTTTGNTGRRKAMRSLLAGATPSSHTLLKMSSNINFGSVGVGIYMLTDKVSGEVRMLQLNDEDSINLPFARANKKSDNIFGKYISNNMFQDRYKGISKWRGTNHTMAKIRLGLSIVRAKQLDPAFKASILLSNTDFSTSTFAELEDLDSILQATRGMIEVASESGEDMPESIKDMLKDDTLFLPETYIPNPLSQLAEYLEMNLTQSDELTRQLSAGGKKTMSELRDIIDDFNPEDDYQALRYRLAEFKHKLSDNASSPLNTFESRKNSPLSKLLDDVLISLHDLDFTLKGENINFIANISSAAFGTSNTHTTSFARAATDATTKVRSGFIDYKVQMKKHVEALAAYHDTNISKAATMLSGSKKAIFSNLFVDKTNKERTEAYMLKSPNDPSLAQVEKDFLLFFNEMTKMHAERSIFGKNIDMMPGWMPLVPRNNTLQEKTGGLKTAYKDVKESVGKFFSRMNVQGDDIERIDSHFSMENPFSGQVPSKKSTAATNYSEGRRRALGLDFTGAAADFAEDIKLDKFEDDLENVLDVFVMASLDTYHYRDVTALGRAMFMNLTRQEDIIEGTLHSVIDNLAVLQQRMLRHESSNGRDVVVQKINNYGYNAVIAGSISQGLLETFTNPSITASVYWGDKLYGLMFSGVREFSAKSFRTAINYVFINKGEKHQVVQALDHKYGISNNDSEKLRSLLAQVNRDGLFSTQNLMFINEYMLTSWQQVTMAAFMIQEGSFDAHSMDKSGNLIYDESKDKRFFNVAKTPKERRELKEHYDLVKQELAKSPDGLKGDRGDSYESRKLGQAWTGYDSNYVKELVVSAYSSMDQAGRSNASFYTFMALFRNMKSWLTGKIPKYFKKPMSSGRNKSLSRAVRINDPSAPDGTKLVWQAPGAEGIIWSVLSITRQLYEYKFQIVSKNHLQPHQKKNLAMLAGEILQMTLMFGIGNALFANVGDDKDERSELQKLAHKRWLMAANDVFLGASILDIAAGNSSMLISISILTRSLKSMGNAMFGAGESLLVGTEEADLAAKVNKMLSSSYGLYKSGEVIYDTARGE